MNPEAKDAAARPASLWGLISLASPVIGGILFVTLRPHHPSPIIGDIGAFFFGAFIGALPGVVAAFVALLRRERRGWITALGFLVNVPLAAFVAFLSVAL